MGPSTLLPSHDQTTFHDCPAARTPGIADVRGSVGAGGAAFAFADRPPTENGFGGFLHFASTFFMPGLCQLCRLLPRGNVEEGLWAVASVAAQPKTTARAICDFTI
jgi:hypothetical protein